MDRPKIRFKGFVDDWEQRKFEKIAERMNAMSGNDIDLPRVEYEDIVSGQGILNKNIFEKNSDKQGICFYEKDILFGKLRPYLKNWLMPDFKGVAVGDFWVLRGNDVTQSFLYSLIQSEQFESVANQSTGTKMPRSDWKLVSQTVFSIPKSEAEQEKIGHIFSQLDHLITLHQRKYEQMQSFKKIMLQKMFPKDGQKNPEVRFEGFTDDWEQRKFGELLDERRDKTKKEDEDTLLSCAIEGMFLNTELFSHFRGSSNIGYLKIKKNDLILSAQNLHLGNCNVNLRFEHGIISPAYKVYSLIDCNPLFMQAWVKRDTTKDFFLRATTEGASACRKNVVWDELYNQEVSIPSLGEQQQIGSYFDNLDNIITLHQRKCEILKELKKFMLQNMFV